jgi:acetyl esterase/lipase
MARIALAVSVVVVLLALAMFLPMPTFSLWLVRLSLRETSLALALLACLAAGLAGLGQRRAPRTSLLALAAALAGGVAAATPFLAAGPVFTASGAEFSLVDYLRGSSAPHIAPRTLSLGSGLAGHVHRGAGEGLRPLVLVVHGGSWRHGAPGEAARMSHALASAGYVVADVSYRLAPTHRFPAPVSDVKCALGRLRERAAELGIDPARVALLGRSAGGEIALVAAYSTGHAAIPPACDVPDQRVSAVVSLYAPTDLAWGHANPVVPDPLDGPRAIEVYLGGPPATQPEAYRLASATSWADRPLPRTLIIHGTGDQLVSPEHARRLFDALGAAAQPVELLLVPFADHGFDRRSGGVGEQLARHKILDFLARGV